MINILVVGDVVSKVGREYFKSCVRKIKGEYSIDLVVVNGENSSKYNGLSPNSAEDLFSYGADVITSGNHIFRNKMTYPLLDDNPYIIRPANYESFEYGKGYTVIDKLSYKILVINLAGTVYMNEEAGNPFKTADKIIRENSDCKVVIVDFHAEATSEKIALGKYLDGRVSAVLGTHTHVQTADEQILPSGTAYITDLGMTGPRDSILGVKNSIIIERFANGDTSRFEMADGKGVFGGALLSIDEKTGKCLKITRIRCFED